MKTIIIDGKAYIEVASKVPFYLDDILGVIKAEKGEDGATIVLTKSGAVAVTEDFYTVLARITQDSKTTEE